MKKLQEINWGIIGVGDVCEVKSAPAMYKLTHSKVIAVMRRNAAKAKDYAQRHNIGKWYDDADALINDPEVNAIYIATPPSSHADYVIKAAEVGKPVYVEKPMARTHEECISMIDACNKNDVPLYVAYYRRCLPNFLKVKNLIAEGAIGEVRMVQMELFQPAKNYVIAVSEENWRVQPEIAGGGYFYDLGSHQFDLLDYLFGPIESVKGHSANQAGLYAAEDIVTASFRFANGVMGTGSWCFTAAEQTTKEQCTIVGSKGRIQFSFFTSVNVLLENEDGKQQFEFIMPQHIQMPLIQTIVHDLRGEGTCPSTGDTAARTNWVLGEINEQ